SAPQSRHGPLNLDTLMGALWQELGARPLGIGPGFCHAIERAEATRVSLPLPPPGHSAWGRSKGNKFFNTLYFLPRRGVFNWAPSYGRRTRVMPAGKGKSFFSQVRLVGAIGACPLARTGPCSRWLRQRSRSSTG